MSIQSDPESPGKKSGKSIDKITEEKQEKVLDQSPTDSNSDKIIVGEKVVNDLRKLGTRKSTRQESLKKAKSPRSMSKRRFFLNKLVNEFRDHDSVCGPVLNADITNIEVMKINEDSDDGSDVCNLI